MTPTPSRLTLAALLLAAATCPSLARAVDADQDGAHVPFDCRDTDASIHPNAQEVG